MRYFHPQNDQEMKLSNHLALLLLLLNFSCNKDNDSEPQFLIGVDHGSVAINKPIPPITISPDDSDSLDLDGDGRYDLIFTKNSVPLLTGFGIETEMIKRSGVQVVLSGVNNYPDSLSHTQKLNNQNNWSSADEQTHILQSYDCWAGSYCNDVGNILHNKESYLGIRMNSRIGWVKLYNEFNTLEIREYALMK